MELNDDFFKEEVRCGFTISSEMKRFWAAQMKVLEYVISVCKKYNIQYFANFGTLLGAVRHKGYVPWDDDIDIVLKRKDYMRLLSALKKENNPEYVVNGCYGRLNELPMLSTVFNYTGVPMPKEVVDKFYGCPYATGIDIFPLDYISRDTQLEETRTDMYLSVAMLAQTYNQIEDDNERDECIKQIEDMCKVPIVRDDTVGTQLWQLADRIASMFTEEESDKLAFFGGHVSFGPDSIYNKEWFDYAISMPFESLNIAVPVGYDNILKRQYGNYMELRRGDALHNYPVYAKQKEFLEKLGIWYC